MSKRTDIHKPSSVIPEDYDFVGVEYTRLDDIGACLMLRAEREEIRAHMAFTGGIYSDHEHGGSCHICGAHAIYTALFWHRDTNVYIRTGFDCADKMHMGDKNKFRAIKKAVKDAREAQAGKQKAKSVLDDADAADAWIIACELSDEELQEMRAGTRDLSVLRDIVGKLIRYGSLSDKQIAYAKVLVEKIRNARSAEECKSQKAAESSHVGVVGNRGDFDLVYTGWTSYDTRYGQMNIHFFEDIKGNQLVWKTSKFPEGQNGEDVDKGSRISCVATVKDHSDYNGVKQTVLTRVSRVVCQ